MENKSYAICITFEDNTYEEFLVTAKSELEAEDKVFCSLCGTIRDSVSSYFVEERKNG
jgi:hypothetical protein